MGLGGVVHVVGGPDVLHSRVLTALLRPEERAACESHSQPCRRRCADSCRGCRRSSNLARRGCEGCCSFCQASQVPEGPTHTLGGNGYLTLLRSHCCRLLYGLRCATLHLLRALPRLVQEGRPIICGGGCGCGPGRGNTFRRTYSAASWGSWERKARSVGRAAQTARNGGRALWVVCQRVDLWVSCKVVLAKAVSSALARRTNPNRTCPPSRSRQSRLRRRHRTRQSRNDGQQEQTQTGRAHKEHGG